MRKQLEQVMNAMWYQGRYRGLSLALLPLSLIFYMLSTLRHLWLKICQQCDQPIPVPVIVVGNIHVGGTGKTPLVIALVEFLKQQGKKPGVLSKGYRAALSTKSLLLLHPSKINVESSIADEAQLITECTGCLVAVGRDRLHAAQQLVAQGCDVIIADDGLQYSRLARELEIITLPPETRLGNGLLLPAGPLRQPYTRLNQLRQTDQEKIKLPEVIKKLGFTKPQQLVVQQTGDFVSSIDEVQLRRPDQLQDSGTGNWFESTLVPIEFVNVRDPNLVKPLSELRHENAVALAGIANPQQFFELLRVLGLNLTSCHAFSDHHAFVAEDFSAFSDECILVTEKDAVKCRTFATENTWALRLGVHCPAAFWQKVLEVLREFD